MDLEQALAAIAALESEKGKLIAKRDELLVETKSKGDRAIHRWIGGDRYSSLRSIGSNFRKSSITSMVTWLSNSLNI